MIGGTKLKSIEQLAARRASDNNDEMLNAYYMSALKPDVVIEIIRLARRYLALRVAGVIILDTEWLFDEHLDAATDRMLEGYSSQVRNGGEK